MAYFRIKNNRDPDAVNHILSMIPGPKARILKLHGAYPELNGCYLVEVDGDPGFAKFACKNQGYADVVEGSDE